MKKLLVYLRPYRLQAILAPVFKLLEAAFELLVPLIMADIIDVGIAAGDTGYILKKCLLLVGLGLCGFASATCAQYFSAKAATGATASLRHALFAHIQSLSYAELDTIGPATLVTRMTSDMNQVQTGLNLTLRLLLRSPIVVFGSMIMAFTIDVRSALIFVVTIPVLFAIVFAIMLSCIPLYRRVQAKLDGVTGAAQENLSGVRVIRAFTREQTETESFDGRLDGLFAAQRFVGKLSALLNPLTYVVINLAIVAILKTGSVRVDAGVITQGQLIALYNYMSQILVELIKFANLILNITKSVACAGRILQVLETKPSMTDGTPCRTAAAARRCSSAASRSAIPARARTRSAISASPPRPGRPSASSAAPARANPRWRTSSRGFTTRRRDRSLCAAKTCGSCGCRRCGPRSASCRRRRCSSPAPSATISAGAMPRPAMKTSGRHCRTRRPIRSSAASRAGWTRKSSPAGAISPAASASG